MALSSLQHQEIMKEYDQIRRNNYLEEQRRKDLIYSSIPAIRLIDEKIAHISVEKARQMLFHPQKDQRDALREEIFELSMEKINLLAIHNFSSDFLDPIYRCPLCRDTGYIGSEKCSCFTQKIVDILYDQSNLKELIQTENFSAFRTEFYSDKKLEMQVLSPRENIENILSLSLDFIRNFQAKPGENLLIYGNAGVGKTFLSNCIAGELLKQGHRVIYLTAYQFFNQLADYTFRRQKENSATLSFLLDSDLLIIDDLGTELNNAFINSQLFLCVNERILHKKSTIISTNLSLKEISRAYTERVSSRIIQSYALFHIYGEDIRIKKAVSSLD